MSKDLLDRIQELLLENASLKERLVETEEELRVKDIEARSLRAVLHMAYDVVLHTDN